LALELCRTYAVADAGLVSHYSLVSTLGSFRVESPTYFHLIIMVPRARRSAVDSVDKLADSVIDISQSLGDAG